MPWEIVEELKAAGTPLSMTHRLEDVVPTADVLYVTRIQKERFPDPQEYERVAGSYRVDLAILREAKKDLIGLHPLPRVTEIDPAVVRSHHAEHYRLEFYTVTVRM